MIELGYIAFVLALLAALYGATVSIVGARRNLGELVASGRNAIYVTGGLVLLAALLLWRALLTDQFQLEYVATHTERSLPTFYKFSAFWGGQEGSLTFWTLLLCAFAVAATWFFRKEQPSLKPWVNAVLLINIAFFCLIVLYAANPFMKLWRAVGGGMVTSVFQPAGATSLIPSDGQGLNPQLQNYWMVVHPVALYLGFIGMTVPFAFAVGALVTGQTGATWIRMVRKWALVPWLFLSIGIILGSQWAYVELGWGGYWAWDPVENASFLPWLTATAFIHSIMITERRGMLKVWSMVLIFATWELTMIGTFLTRSGVVQSVHSFALSPIGPMFAGFIVLSFLAFAALLIWRYDKLRADNELDSVMSRETSFLTQNVLFFVIMLAVFLGTIFGSLSEIILGNRIALNAPYFQKVGGPMFVALLIVMGAAPLLAWRRTAPEKLWRNFAIPVAVGLLVIPLLFLFGNRTRAGFVGFPIIAFVFTGIVQEYVRGMRARMGKHGENAPAALVNLIRRTPRRYGGYLVHVGVLFIAMAIMGNTFYQSEGEANLKPGESITVANFTLAYRNLTPDNGPNYVEYTAAMDLSRGGQAAGQIFPKKIIYNKNQEQPMTEVGLRMGPIEDVYVVLAGFEGAGSTASFKVFINPLMSWMWVGGILMILGVLASTWPRRVGQAVEAAARVPAGAQPAGGN